MKAYALYLKDEEKDKFELFTDEFQTSNKDTDTFIDLLKVFPDKRQAYRYVEDWGYSDDEIDIREVRLVSVDDDHEEEFNNYVKNTSGVNEA